MSFSKCIVRLKDCHNTEHSVEVYAESLYEAVLPLCPSSAQNPKPADPGRKRYRCLRQECIIKARDSAMPAT